MNLWFEAPRKSLLMHKFKIESATVEKTSCANAVVEFYLTRNVGVLVQNTLTGTPAVPALLFCIFSATT